LEGRTGKKNSYQNLILGIGFHVKVVSDDIEIGLRGNTGML
jgi:hypothetical protein